VRRREQLADDDQREGLAHLMDAVGRIDWNHSAACVRRGGNFSVSLGHLRRLFGGMAFGGTHVASGGTRVASGRTRVPFGGDHVRPAPLTPSADCLTEELLRQRWRAASLTKATEALRWRRPRHMCRAASLGSRYLWLRCGPNDISLELTCCDSRQANCDGGGARSRAVPRAIRQRGCDFTVVLVPSRDDGAPQFCVGPAEVTCGRHYQRGERPHVLNVLHTMSFVRLPSQTDEFTLRPHQLASQGQSLTSQNRRVQ
jgi:hypothetical protein